MELRIEWWCFVNLQKGFSPGQLVTACICRQLAQHYWFKCWRSMPSNSKDQARHRTAVKKWNSCSYNTGCMPKQRQLANPSEMKKYRFWAYGYGTQMLDETQWSHYCLLEWYLLMSCLAIARRATTSPFATALTSWPQELVVASESISLTVTCLLCSWWLSKRDSD